MDEDKTKLTFLVTEEIRGNQYEVITIRKSIMIKIKNNLTYLINGDIAGMALSMSCGCGYELNSNNVGSVISGNGSVFGIIMCQNCRTIKLCEFSEYSKEAIIRAFNLTEEMINHEWGNFESPYIH